MPIYDMKSLSIERDNTAVSAIFICLDGCVENLMKQLARKGVEGEICESERKSERESSLYALGRAVHKIATNLH